MAPSAGNAGRRRRRRRTAFPPLVAVLLPLARGLRPTLLAPSTAAAAAAVARSRVFSAAPLSPKSTSTSFVTLRTLLTVRGGSDEEGGESLLSDDEYEYEYDFEDEGEEEEKEEEDAAPPTENSEGWWRDPLAQFDEEDGGGEGLEQGDFKGGEGGTGVGGSPGLASVASKQVPSRKKAGRGGGRGRVTSSSAASSSVLPALLAGAGAMARSHPFVKVAASAAAAQFVLRRAAVKWHDRRLMLKAAGENGKGSIIDEEEDNETVEAEDDGFEEDGEEEDDEAPEKLESLGFGRPLPRRQKVPKEDVEIEKSEQDEEEDNKDGDDDGYGDMGRPGRTEARSPPEKKRSLRSPRLQEGKKALRSLLGARLSGQRKPKHVSVNELMDETASLRERAEAAEEERDAVTREYEAAVRKLTEARGQQADLLAANKQLKGQLRNNERSVEQALRTERQRADEEMARVREAIQGLLERERRLMRLRVKNSSAQVRALIQEERERRGLSGGNVDDGGYEQGYAYRSDEEESDF